MHEKNYYNDYGAGRIMARRVDEFIGMSRSLAAKPWLGESDVEALDQWLERNHQVKDEPLVQEICQSLDQLYTGKQLQKASMDAFHSLLRRLCGMDSSTGEWKPTSLPLSDPVPELSFYRKRYCFSGTFDYGTRNKCEQAVKKRGATAGNIAKCTDFLVIGNRATDAWKHSSYGTKIEKAVAWQGQGSPVKIVSEDHWVEALSLPQWPEAAIAKLPGPSEQAGKSVYLLPPPG